MSNLERYGAGCNVVSSAGNLGDPVSALVDPADGYVCEYPVVAGPDGPHYWAH